MISFNCVRESVRLHIKQFTKTIIVQSNCLTFFNSLVSGSDRCIDHLNAFFPLQLVGGFHLAFGPCHKDCILNRNLFWVSFFLYKDGYELKFTRNFPVYKIDQHFSMTFNFGIKLTKIQIYE